MSLFLHDLLRLGHFFELDFSVATDALLRELEGQDWQAETETHVRRLRLTSPDVLPPSLIPFVEHFSPTLRELDFMRFERGGYLPPGRDLDDTQLTLLLPISRTNSSEFVYILGRDRLLLQEGGTYFINEQMSNSAFSFVDGALILRVKLEANADSVHRVKTKLTDR